MDNDDSSNDAGSREAAPQLCLPRRHFTCGAFYTNNYGYRMFWPIPREPWWPYDPGWPPKGVEIRALDRGVWDITCPSGEIVELTVE